MKTMRFTFLFCLFLMHTSLLYAQQKNTLSGYITEASTGEAIIGAKVFVPMLKQGAVTNTYGFYSLTIEAGIHDIEIRATGMT